MGITKFVTKSWPSRALMLFPLPNCRHVQPWSRQLSACSNIRLNKPKRARCRLPWLPPAAPLQPTLALIRSENDACCRSDKSAGNKQMVPGELYLLMLERGLNLFCWFTIRFTPCNSGRAFLHSKCPKFH